MLLYMHSVDASHALCLGRSRTPTSGSPTHVNSNHCQQRDNSAFESSGSSFPNDLSTNRGAFLVELGMVLSLQTLARRDPQLKVQGSPVLER